MRATPAIALAARRTSQSSRESLHRRMLARSVAGSRPPRSGSRTNKYTINAATMPTAPSTTNALRQLYAAAIDAPNATPNACPNGGPRLNSPSAVARVPESKVIGNDRVGRRHTARLADSDRHARGDELRISGRESAGNRRRTPQRARERQARELDWSDLRATRRESRSGSRTARSTAR